MKEFDAHLFLEALKGLIQQMINDARPGHQKMSRDDVDHEEEMLKLLTGKHWSQEGAPK